MPILTPRVKRTRDKVFTWCQQEEERRPFLDSDSPSYFLVSDVWFFFVVFFFSFSLGKEIIFMHKKSAWVYTLQETKQQSILLIFLYCFSQKDIFFRNVLKLFFYPIMLFSLFVFILRIIITLKGTHM